MRKLSYIIIIAGLLLMLYPKGSEWFEDWKQQRLLEQAEQSFDQSPKQSEVAGGTAADPDLSLKYAKVTQLLADESALNEQDQLSEAEQDPASDEKAIALIEIPSIDVKLPVLEGATKANMRHAAVHMTETAPLGGIGNSAIAAHRAHTKGRLFNRLGEVKIGDTITIKTKSEDLEYKVYEILVVEPTDVSVLEGNNKDRILTLITCDPLINPTHRLIIHAKLEA
ncbi:class D sortase [Paenibacillus sp. HN-1]|uniref:class D sortase n=1 Tax=Paenibacillus TaxID=44249 RepID=UPI001CA7C879|nr:MULTISPECIES: class D sortase [Paenibacillus]MBY9079808.1 class D sortase [Paenibacillus sp. CGMCC 1.18879]MBY9084450.1 class D sortase [Paenibacillus sinensis]